MKQVKVVVFLAFYLECMKELHKTWRADVSWPLWNWLHFCHGLLNFFIFVMSAPWFRANLTGLWGLRGVRVSKSVDLLDHLYFVISEDIKKQIFAYESYPVTNRGYAWLLCSQKFIVLIMLALPRLCESKFCGPRCNSKIDTGSIYSCEKR